MIHAECTAGKLRFWFDPQGELYVVCDEAQLEEVTMPSSDDRLREPVARWTFQSQTAEWPTVEWLLEELDGAGLPCTWKKAKTPNAGKSVIQWEGTLLPAQGADTIEEAAVHVMLYGPLDGAGFGILLHVDGSHTSAANRVLSCLSDLIVRRFSGQCLVGNTIIPGGEWLNWKSLEQLRWRRAGSSKNNQNAVAGTIEWSKRVVLTLGEGFFVRCSGAKAARSRSVDGRAVRVGGRFFVRDAVAVLTIHAFNQGPKS